MMMMGQLEENQREERKQAYVGIERRRDCPDDGWECGRNWFALPLGGNVDRLVEL